MNSRIMHVALYILLGYALVVSSSLVYGMEKKEVEFANRVVAAQEDLQKVHKATQDLKEVRREVAKQADLGIEVTSFRASLESALDLLEKGEIQAAVQSIAETEAAILAAVAQREAEAVEAARLKAEEEAAAKAKAEEEERKRGNLKGTVSSAGKPLASAQITLLLGKESLATATSDSKGIFSLRYTAGTYTVTAQKSGYVKLTQQNVTITAGQSAVLDLSLEKLPAPAPVAATPTPSESTAYSSYRQETVATELGSFTVKLLTVDLSSGKVRVITDTAADGDCATDCPVKSVKDYVSGHAGFAGVNGTYFCPTAYPDCAGKTNSFYWKVFNSRLQLMVNANNGLGHDAPFFIFSATGKPQFFTRWDIFNSSGNSLYAGISSRPLLVSGGQNVLNVSSLDEKEKTTKGTRTGFGIKGQTAYVAVASSATIIDMAAIMKAYGVDSAMSLDGGGSSGLYYNGSYKSGPGRNVPNAIIFKAL